MAKINSGLIWSILLGYSIGNYAEKELRLLGLQAMSGKLYSGGWSCLVPVRMALEDVNANPDILSEYKIIYEYFDHEVFINNTLSLPL